MRQDGIISPVLFCIYTDGLLCMLSESYCVGCYTGNVFVGAFAYADDIALLAPTPSAMPRFVYVMHTVSSFLLCLRGLLRARVNSRLIVYLSFTLVVSI